MTAVVDRAAALGLLMNSAEELPFRCAHLGACRGGAGRCVEKEPYDQGVALRDEEAAELVEPEGSIDTGWWLCELIGCVAVDGLGARGGEVVV